MYARRFRIFSLITLLLLWASPTALADSADPVSSAVEVQQPTSTASASQLVKPKPPIHQPSSVAAPVPAPVRKKSPVQRIDRSQRPSEHLVRKGDWLSKIAVRYGMSVQEVMDLNGLVDDSIDIGDTLILRARAAKPVEEPPVEPPVASRMPKADVLSEPAQSNAAKAAQDVEALPSVPAAEGSGDDVGLTAAQLVGGLDVPGDERPQAVAEADVSIPTPMTSSVNPLSRARLALAVALLVLGLLTIHPRSRSMLLDRIPGLNLRPSGGRAPLAVIELQATRRVGSNQQVIMLEVSGARLLVGVSDGRMDVLHRWDDRRQEQSASVMTSTSTVTSAPNADNPVSNIPDIAPTVRQSVVRADQQSSGPALPPSAEDLVGTWRDDVNLDSGDDKNTGENLPWWMEGATSFERAVLSEDDVESIREDAPQADSSAERERVQESILATLRERRNAEKSTVQTSERGMHERSANSHGGFRAAARLGRKPRLGNNNQASSAAPNRHHAEGAAGGRTGQRRSRGGGSMSFKL